MRIFSRSLAFMRLFVDILDLLVLCCCCCWGCWCCCCCVVAAVVSWVLKSKGKSPASSCPLELHISGEEHTESAENSGEADCSKFLSSPMDLPQSDNISTVKTSKFMLGSISELRSVSTKVRIRFKSDDSMNWAVRYLCRRRSPEVYRFTAQAKKVQRNPQVAQPSWRTPFVITMVWIGLNRRIMRQKDK